MTRQEQITLAQVYHKRDKAARDVKEHLSKALAFAENQNLYDKHLALSRKAAEDFKTWSTCLESLQPA